MHCAAFAYIPCLMNIDMQIPYGRRSLKAGRLCVIMGLTALLIALVMFRDADDRPAAHGVAGHDRVQR